MRHSILEGITMNYPPPSALLPSPTFVTPMVPSIYPVSLYSRAVGSMPFPPQGRNRGFAGQYLRIRCLSSSICFIITNPVIIPSYRISSAKYILSHLSFLLHFDSLKSTLLSRRAVAWGRKSIDFTDHSPYRWLIPKNLTLTNQTPEVTDVETRSPLITFENSNSRELDLHCWFHLSVPIRQMYREELAGRAVGGESKWPLSGDEHSVMYVSTFTLGVDLIHLQKHREK